MAYGCLKPMRVCKYSANIIKNSQKRAERPCFLSFFQHWSTIFPRNRYPEMTTVAQMFRIPHVCHEHIVISDVATQVGFNTPKYFSQKVSRCMLFPYMTTVKLLITVIIRGNLPIFLTFPRLIIYLFVSLQHNKQIIYRKI